MKQKEPTIFRPTYQGADDALLTDSFLLSFCLMRPSVFAATLCLPQLVCSLLNFKSSSKTFLYFILGEIGESTSHVERKREKMARVLWPNDGLLTAKDKLRRMLRAFTDDQVACGICFVDCKEGFRQTKADGSFNWVASRYRVERFYELAEIVSAAMAAECLLTLPMDQRELRYRGIVRQALLQMGGKAIVRQVKPKQRKSKGEAMNDKEEEREDDATAYEQAYLVRNEARLPLSERVELEFDSAYASIKRVCDLFPEFEKPEEMKHVADKLLKYLVSNVNQALDEGYKRFAHVANVNRVEPYNVRDMAKYKKRRGLK